jgi:hypothetical protein
MDQDPWAEGGHDLEVLELDVAAGTHHVRGVDEQDVVRFELAEER